VKGFYTRPDSAHSRARCYNFHYGHVRHVRILGTARKGGHVRVMGGPLQKTVDSFDSTQMKNYAYVSKFIDKVVAPAVCVETGLPVNSANIVMPAVTWEGEYFHVKEPFDMKLYPEAQTATAIV
jgi:hypothetical protein